VHTTVCCRQANDAAPNRVPTLQAWARLEAKAGALEEARRLFRRAADLDPDNVYVLQARLMHPPKSRCSAEAMQCVFSWCNALLLMVLRGSGRGIGRLRKWSMPTVAQPGPIPVQACPGHQILPNVHSHDTEPCPHLRC